LKRTYGNERECRDLERSPISQIVVWLAATKLILHLAFNALSTYGIFRDELYYLACSNHLSFGYVDHPPLSIFLLWVQTLLFGDSLFAVRILPAVAGAVTTFMVGLIARELGGGRFAQGLAALCFLVVPAYLVTNGFYSMNSFDVLLWTCVLYLFIRLIQSMRRDLWIVLGIVVGLGSLNKLSMLFLCVGLIGSLLLTSYRTQFRNKYAWFAALIAMLMLAPYVVWQAANDWPTMEFMANAQADIDKLSVPMYFVSQVFLLNPVMSIIWIPGLLWLLFSVSQRRLRIVGIIYIVIFVFLALQRTKPYYLFPYYSALFAAGAVFWERAFSARQLRWAKAALPAIITVAGILTAPFGLPVLPEETLVNYAQILGPPVEASPDEDEEPGPLPQYFADRHGWEQLAVAVSEVYETLPADEKAEAVIFGNNYGEAAAFDYYQNDYPLPPVISGHNAYWFWGPGAATGSVVIHIGGSSEVYEQYYDSSVLIKEIDCRYCMPEERHLGIFVSRRRHTPLSLDWGRVKHFD
jgi:hypothetical protein